ncbi:MAG: AzlD domain-containing protein [Pseudoruegeria sp.]
MTYTTAQIWVIIILMGVGSFLVRFSFLGLIGDKELPAWILRVLRYTPVAVLPALVAPLVMWPTATDGTPDPARLLAAVATFSAGYLSKNVFVAIFCGATTLYTMLYLFG